MSEALPEWLVWGELFQWITLGVLWIKVWDWPLVSEAVRSLRDSTTEEGRDD